MTDEEETVKNVRVTNLKTTLVVNRYLEEKFVDWYPRSLLCEEDLINFKRSDMSQDVRLREDYSNLSSYHTYVDLWEEEWKMCLEKENQKFLDLIRSFPNHTHYVRSYNSNLQLPVMKTVPTITEIMSFENGCVFDGVWIKTVKENQFILSNFISAERVKESEIEDPFIHKKMDLSMQKEWSCSITDFYNLHYAWEKTIVSEPKQNKLFVRATNSKEGDMRSLLSILKLEKFLGPDNLHEMAVRDMSECIVGKRLSEDTIGSNILMENNLKPDILVELDLLFPNDPWLKHDLQTSLNLSKVKLLLIEFTRSSKLDSKLGKYQNVSIKLKGKKVNPMEVLIIYGDMEDCYHWTCVLGNKKKIISSSMEYSSLKTLFVKHPVIKETNLEKWELILKSLDQFYGSKFNSEFYSLDEEGKSVVLSKSDLLSVDPVDPLIIKTNWLNHYKRIRKKNIPDLSKSEIQKEEEMREDDEGSGCYSARDFTNMSKKRFKELCEQKGSTDSSSEERFLKSIVPINSEWKMSTQKALNPLELISLISNSTQTYAVEHEHHFPILSMDLVPIEEKGEAKTESTWANIFKNSCKIRHSHEDYKQSAFSENNSAILWNKVNSGRHIVSPEKYNMENTSDFLKITEKAFRTSTLSNQTEFLQKFSRMLVGKQHYRKTIRKLEIKGRKMPRDSRRVGILFKVVDSLFCYVWPGSMLKKEGNIVVSFVSLEGLFEGRWLPTSDRKIFVSEPYTLDEFTVKTWMRIDDLALQFYRYGVDLNMVSKNKENLFNFNTSTWLCTLAAMESRRATSTSVQLFRFLMMGLFAFDFNWEEFFSKIGSEPCHSPLQNMLILETLRFLQNRVPLVKAMPNKANHFMLDRFLDSDNWEFEECLNYSYICNCFEAEAGFHGHRITEIFDKMMEKEAKFKANLKKHKGLLNMSLIKSFDKNEDFCYNSSLLKSSVLVCLTDYFEKEDVMSAKLKAYKSTFDSVSYLKSSLVQSWSEQNKSTRSKAALSLLQNYREDGVFSAIGSANLYKNERLVWFMFPKSQIGGPREISIMNRRSRMAVLLTERFYYWLDSKLPMEELTKGQRKVDEQVRMSEKGKWKTSDLQGVTKINANLDMSKWGPGVNVLSLTQMTLFMGEKLNINLDLISSIPTIFLNKMIIIEGYLKKLVESQTEEWKKRNPNLILLTDEREVKWVTGHKDRRGIEDFTKGFGFRFYFSGMGQGMLHYTSSFFHCLMTMILRKVFLAKLSSLVEDVSFNCQVSSDDCTYYILIKWKDSYFNLPKTQQKIHFLSLFYRFKSALFLLASHFNIQINEKKSCYSFVNEFNSNFALGSRMMIPMCKFLFKANLIPDLSSPTRAEQDLLNGERRLLESGCSRFVTEGQRELDSQLLKDAYEEVGKLLVSGNLPTKHTFLSCYFGINFYSILGQFNAEWADNWKAMNILQSEDLLSEDVDLDLDEQSHSMVNHSVFKLTDQSKTKIEAFRKEIMEETKSILNLNKEEVLLKFKTNPLMMAEVNFTTTEMCIRSILRPFMGSSRHDVSTRNFIDSWIKAKSANTKGGFIGSEEKTMKLRDLDQWILKQDLSKKQELHLNKNMIKCMKLCYEEIERVLKEEKELFRSSSCLSFVHENYLHQFPSTIKSTKNFLMEWFHNPERINEFDLKTFYEFFGSDTDSFDSLNPYELARRKYPKSKFPLNDLILELEMYSMFSRKLLPKMLGFHNESSSIMSFLSSLFSGNIYKAFSLRRKQKLGMVQKSLWLAANNIPLLKLPSDDGTLDFLALKTFYSGCLKLNEENKSEFSSLTSFASLKKFNALFFLDRGVAFTKFQNEVEVFVTKYTRQVKLTIPNKMDREAFWNLCLRKAGEDTISILYKGKTRFCKMSKQITLSMSNYSRSDKGDRLSYTVNVTNSENKIWTLYKAGLLLRSFRMKEEDRNNLKEYFPEVSLKSWEKPWWKLEEMIQKNSKELTNFRPYNGVMQNKLWVLANENTPLKEEEEFLEDIKDSQEGMDPTDLMDSLLEDSVSTYIAMSESLASDEKLDDLATVDPSEVIPEYIEVIDSQFVDASLSLMNELDKFDTDEENFKENLPGRDFVINTTDMVRLASTIFFQSKKISLEDFWLRYLSNKGRKFSDCSVTERRFVSTMVILKFLHLFGMNEETYYGLVKKMPDTCLGNYHFRTKEDEADVLE